MRKSLLAMTLCLTSASTFAAGETAELVWTAPGDVDTLVYACNIPGHYESGMVGEIQLGR